MSDWTDVSWQTEERISTLGAAQQVRFIDTSSLRFFFYENRNRYLECCVKTSELCWGPKAPPSPAVSRRGAFEQIHCWTKLTTMVFIQRKKKSTPPLGLSIKFLPPNKCLRFRRVHGTIHTNLIQSLFLPFSFKDHFQVNSFKFSVEFMSTSGLKHWADLCRHL